MGCHSQGHWGLDESQAWVPWRSCVVFSIHPSSAWDFYLLVGTQDTTKKEKEGGHGEKEEKGRE